MSENDAARTVAIGCRIVFKLLLTAAVVVFATVIQAIVLREICGLDPEASFIRALYLSWGQAAGFWIGRAVK